MILLFRWKAKHAIGKPLLDREREREKGKRRFCDQCCRIDVKEKSTEQNKSDSRQTHTKSYSEESQKILLWRVSQKILFWWMRSPRTSSRKSSTSYAWWKFNSEKIFLNECIMKMQNLERRNSEYAVAAWAWISKTTIVGSQSDQAQREKIHCVADWGWRIIFIKNAMQEVAEKLKNWKDAALRKEITKKKWSLKEFPTQHDQ